MSAARQAYIDRYKNVAVDTTRGTGLFPSVMLAQGIVESNNGNSTLSKDYNNHFGIKADSSWKGPKVNMNTREVVSGQSQMQGAYFRVYDSAEDSFRDRVKFLQQNSRYQKAGVFTAKTPMEQLKALQSAGYATDPQYAEIINSVVVKENLGVLDFIKKHKKVVGLGLIALLFIIFGIVLILTRKKIADAVAK